MLNRVNTYYASKLKYACFIPYRAGEIAQYYWRSCKQAQSQDRTELQDQNRCPRPEVLWIFMTLFFLWLVRQRPFSSNLERSTGDPRGSSRRTTRECRKEQMRRQKSMGRRSAESQGLICVTCFSCCHFCCLICCSTR